MREGHQEEVAPSPNSMDSCSPVLDFGNIRDARSRSGRLKGKVLGNHRVTPPLQEPKSRVHPLFARLRLLPKTPLMRPPAIPGTRVHRRPKVF
jgi:hypothetical protein